MDAIETKKSLTIVNSFVVTTTEFINHFCARAHQKLSLVNRKVEKLEALTALLEHKVDSIPEHVPEPPKQEPSKQEPASSNPQASQEEAPKEPEPAPIDEAYLIYVRMLKVGVPRAAVKHKMVADDLDPNKLDEMMPPTEE